MIRRIVKYIGIELNSVAFERDRVQLQAYAQKKDKRIQVLRGKVRVLRTDNTELQSHVQNKGEHLEDLSCLGSSRPAQQAVYRRLLEALSSDGYGYDSGFMDERKHYPVAYALIASAEAHRYLATKDKAALSSAK